jgi:hypothetical protein
MDKIKELFKQLGASQELTEQILSAITTHISESKKKIESDTQAKVQKVKQVCLEEVKRHKADLARKVQIYFESKSDKIEQQITKSVAIKESAAEQQLKSIKALLEGIQLNEEGQADLQALKTQVDTLSKQVGVVTEEKNTAVKKANRAVEIAQKILSRNRELEALVEEGKKANDKVVSEAKVEPKKEEPAKEPVKEPAKEEPKKEDPKADEKVKTEGVQQPVAAVKKEGDTPVTTTVVAQETVAKKADPVVEGTKPVPTKTMSWDINAIAGLVSD